MIGKNEAGALSKRQRVPKKQNPGSAGVL